MPISGLAITLSADPAQRAIALNALHAHPRLTIGDRQPHAKLPVVMETENSDVDREVWQWLHELPGVQFVDVVYVHFDRELQDVTGG